MKFIGTFLAFLLISLMGFLLIALFVKSEIRADFSFLQDPFIRHVIWYSFYQATLSTLLSLIFAIPISLAFYRREFVFKNFMQSLFSLSFVLPSLLVVFGILAIYGNQGFLARYFGLKANIYGLSGILLAHVFFNLPLCVKYFHQSLTLISQNEHKLAQNLNFNLFQKFRFVEFPRILLQIPHVASLVFMLTFTSFTIVLALGGKISNATIEVAIYQAITYDFDLFMAASLSLLQIFFCSFIYFISQIFIKTHKIPLISTRSKVYFSDTLSLKIWDYFCIFACLLFLIPPILSIIIQGISFDLLSLLTHKEIYLAILNSFIIASFSSSMALMISYFICKAKIAYKNHKHFSSILELSSTIMLLIPSIVIATSFFIILNSSINVFDHAMLFVILTNSLISLPFVIKQVYEPLLSLHVRFHKLILSLGFGCISSFYLIEFKALKKIFLSAFGISFVLSFGDFSAISLFGSPEFKTLPLVLYEHLGSYHSSQASSVALILLVVCLAVFLPLEYFAKSSHVRN